MLDQTVQTQCKQFRYAWPNSADSDQTAPKRAVWSGSALFVSQTALLDISLGTVKHFYLMFCLFGCYQQSKEKLPKYNNLPVFNFLQMEKV